MVLVDTKQLCQDLSLDIIKYMQPGATMDDLMGIGLEPAKAVTNGEGRQADPGYWCPNMDSSSKPLELEPDAPESLVPAQMQADVWEPAAASEDDRTSKLFPNAFRISGLKHVCDNLCGSILAGLPQLLVKSYPVRSLNQPPQLFTPYSL